MICHLKVHEGHVALQRQLVLSDIIHDLSLLMTSEYTRIRWADKFKLFHDRKVLRIVEPGAPGIQKLVAEGHGGSASHAPSL